MFLFSTKITFLLNFLSPNNANGSEHAIIVWNFVMYKLEICILLASIYKRYENPKFKGTSISPLIAFPRPLYQRNLLEPFLYFQLRSWQQFLSVGGLEVPLPHKKWTQKPAEKASCAVCFVHQRTKRDLTHSRLIRFIVAAATAIN